MSYWLLAELVIIVQPRDMNFKLNYNEASSLFRSLEPAAGYSQSKVKSSTMNEGVKEIFFFIG